MNRLHIIAFDVPYPPNYGGVIDVFYKIKYLHQIGVKIILHCFEYGRGEPPVLKNYCEKIYYYKRSKSIFHQFSILPFIVKTRINEKLIQNILKDNAPILFEGLHTCGYLSDKRIKNRIKIYRESNIEHDYYLHLAKSERSIVKKIYFYLESFKLYYFQYHLQNADYILGVSKADCDYLKIKFPSSNTIFLPSFHSNPTVNSRSGTGKYILYHGNLQIAENYTAATFLIKEVFTNSKLNYIIAGLNPPDALKSLILMHPNVQLIENPDHESLEELIKEAHINCIITNQPTGLKLKLLNALYLGRHCLVNSNMLIGTTFHELCYTADTAEDLKNKIELLVNLTFDNVEIDKRNEKLKPYDVFINAKRILKLIDV